MADQLAAASSSKCLVYSSENSSYLADLVCACIDGERGAIERKRFGDGESYYRIDMADNNSLVGRDVVYVTSTASDSDFLELVRIGCALAAYGARRRVFVVPFLGYSTMERQVKPGEVITSKVNARMLSAIPDAQLGNCFMLMDLHVQGLLQYFEGPCLKQELYAEPVLMEGIRQRLDLSEPFMFASADLGRPLWVQTFAKNFGVGMAFVRKERTSEGTAVEQVIGDVSGKHVIIYDDMTRSGGTLINAAQAYLDSGATRVSAVLSHFALSDEAAIDRMLASEAIDVVISTNTHPMSQHAKVASSDKFLIMDVSKIFGERVKLMCGQ